MLRGLDLPHLAVLLERAGVAVLAMCPVHAQDLIHPVERAVDAGSEAIVGPEPLTERLVAAARELVDAEVAWVISGEHPSVRGSCRNSPGDQRGLPGPGAGEVAGVAVAAVCAFDSGQGYHYFRPMPADAAAELIHGQLAQRPTGPRAPAQRDA